MSDLETSPFSKPKTRLWVWIVPSILVHVVVLAIWLLMPEPERREPGERKLNIKEEQAEELQKHVEEANLTELRREVSELQSIKAAMARIREREMNQVREFEETMEEEAPQDVAALLSELAGIYSSVYETYEGILDTVEGFEKKYPAVKAAAEEDSVAGIRALGQLKPLWDSLDGISDRFEVAFYETGATLKSIEVKLEWLQDETVVGRIEALKPPMEKVFEMHREAWSSLPFNWKRANSFYDLTENSEERIEAIETFRQNEIEGKAKVAAKREELEERIAEVEVRLARTTGEKKSAEAALKGLDRNQDRDAWNAKRGEVRELENKRRSLRNELRSLNRELSRTDYRPNGKQARNVRRIEGRLEHALPPLPDRAGIERAMEEQLEMIRRINELTESLEGGR